MSPPTLNLDCGDCKPIPTFPENSAIPTVPSASILKDGIPDISLTENIVPVVTAFDTENNCPEDPSKEIVLSSKTLSTIGSLLYPVNEILGNADLFLFVTIRMSLSEFAIIVFFF